MLKKSSPWVLYAGIVLVSLVAFLFFHSPYFTVNKVMVVGTSRLSEQDVRSLLEIRGDLNLWSLDLERLSLRLRENPWIEQARLRRRLPGTLEVHITERIPAAVVPYYRYFLVLDSNGVVVSMAESLSAANLPVITGAAVPQAILGQVYPEAKVNLGLKMLSILGPEWSRTVSEVHVGSPDEIVLYGSDELVVRIGQAKDVAKKAEDLRIILSDARAKGLKIKYVDLRFDGKPVVRLKQ